jgi:uncharacterized protein
MRDKNAGHPMADDDLSKPLGLDKTKRRREKRPVIPIILIGGIGALLVCGAYLEWRGDPFGGEPHAVAMLEKPAKISLPDPHDETAKGATAPRDLSIAPSNASVETAAEVETQSGVKVIRSGGKAPPGAMIIDVSRALGARLTAAPDQRLTEKSRYGLLPRIGADGAKPADVYARLLTGKIDGPRIALVVGGMGLSQSSTATAIAALPPAVTLAFAPYGEDLDGETTQARSAGHEIVLQLPMEPIDLARGNPGPHVLRTSASPAQNLDDLHWLLSRFTGYAGVSSFLGGKFVADDAAMTPILREIEARGLFYFDDGTAAGSIVAARAAELNLPLTKADIVLDAVGRPEAIDAALTKLEIIAREKGLAIGSASGLPVSLARLERFARQAEARGLVLIPLSAARTIAKVSEVSRPQAAQH